MIQCSPSQPIVSRMLAAIFTLAAVASPALTPLPAHADERRFTFIYESPTEMPGEVEYEQYVTWKTNKDTDSSYDRVDFRHELEFGITDRFQLAVYLSDWSYEDGRSVEDDGADWKDVALEGIYNFTDRSTDLLGVSLYGETAIGDEVFKLEGKLILDKQIGNWLFAYNITLEAEWEGDDYAEDVGEFQQTLGVSTMLGENWYVGAELLHEVEYEDWTESSPDVVYAGPNFGYTAGGWFITVTPMIQLTDVGDEPSYQTRMIFGWTF